jgi:hypothetical protein
MNAGEFQFQLQKSILLFACFATAILVGLLLVGAPFYLVLALFGVVWLMTLPYQTVIAIYLAIATINSALIIPAVPGRPFWWELAAGLGWSGAIVTLALRRQAAGAAERVGRNRMLFVGVLGYCAVLLFLMYYRGVGIRALSSESGGGQMGGRLYVQQLACAIFPILLVINPLSERTLVRLFVIQCVLAFTYLVSDFLFSFARGPLFDLLLFFELPSDGLNFESQSVNFGIRRFQSLFFVTFALLSLLWIKRPLRDYANQNGLWLWPVTFALLGVGVLSGHRVLVYTAGCTVLIMGWAQRFFSFQRVTVVVVLGSIIYLGAYTVVRDLPLAAQRSLSIIPGIEVDRAADDDGRATLEGRAAVRKAGWTESQKYRWIGRGLGKLQAHDASLYQYDFTYMHVENGVFYNGTIGLLVNTGLPGTFFMFLFMGGVTIAAGRVLLFIRRHGAEDDFSRFSGFQAALWISNAFSFVFMHGDSEFAMRSFAMPAGLLVACEWHLRRRLRSQMISPVPVADGSSSDLQLESAGARS